MSRTISIRKIRKLSKEEVTKLSSYTSGDIVRAYDTLWSFFEEELDKNMQALKDCMTPIITKNGNVMFVAQCEILTMCSDHLLAEAIEACIHYKRGTYADITELSSDEPKVFEGAETAFRLNPETGKIEPYTRKMKFILPPKEEGVKYIFFDDMD